MQTKTVRNVSILLLFLFIGSIFEPNSIKSTIESSEIENTNDNHLNSELQKYSLPDSSEMGQIEWWNIDFSHRMQINITNTGSENFVDTFASITFNYTEKVNEGKMNESLKDVRIVENEIIRKYYIQKDFPEKDMARIWFQTNCSASTTEYDAFMYYGNDTLNFETSKLLTYHPMGIMWQPMDSIYTDVESGTKYINDSSGNNDGIVQNTPQLVAGKIDNCLSFGGNTDPDYILLGNPEELQISGSQTIAMWIKPTQLYARQNPYAKAYGGEGTITLEPAGTLNYYYGISGYDGGSYQGISSRSGAVGITDWVYITIVRDFTTGTGRWYINGILDTTRTLSFSSATIGSLPAYIGRGYVSYFWGLIDDFRMYNTSLSQSEISRIMNFKYLLTTELADEVEQGAQVTIITRDIDGKAVANAKVSLYNSSGLAFSAYSDEVGQVVFSTIPYAYYNLTVNYTLPLTGEEVTVFTGNKTGGIVEFSGLIEERTFYVDLWTIDFIVEDFDGEIMDYGYIEIYTNDTKEEILGNLTLSSGTGTQEFCWLNTTSYYYEIFYSNQDYRQTSTLLDNDTIFRQDFSKIVNYNLNETSTGSFYSTQYIWANGSSGSTLGSTKLINTTITISNVNDYMSKVDIYYVNSLKQNVKITEASQTYSNEPNSDVIECVISDSYEAYGLKIDIFGDNSTQCDGTVSISLVQTTSIGIITNMSKVVIRVMDDNAIEPVSGAIVHVYSGTNSSENLLVDLLTDDDGYAYGMINHELEFWYLQDEYNFTLEFFGELKYFDVNSTNPAQWEPSTVKLYNYSVVEQSTIVFAMTIDLSNYQTHLTLVYQTLDVVWGENIEFSVNFTYSDLIYTNEPLTNPDSITCLISGNIDHQVSMIHVGSGIFNATINSSIFSAGTTQSMLTVLITGSKIGFTSPNQIFRLVIFNPIEMDVAFHDYYDVGLSEIPNKTVSQYYDEDVNFTISYFIGGSPTSRFSGASLNYYWDYGAENDIQEDPINPGYYTFTLSTGDAPNIGKYGIHISISLENHTFESIDGFIDILPRPTSLNSSSTALTSELLRISVSLNESDSYFFNFTYTDQLDGNPIITATILTFAWEFVDEGITGTGDLVLVDNYYQINSDEFNTSSLDNGNYIVLVTISQQNYEQRQALIVITIEERLIWYELQDDISEGQYFEERGSDWNLAIELKDQSREFSPLLNAEVYFYFSSVGYRLNLTDFDNDGVYTNLTHWDDIKGIFGTEIDSFTAVLTIQKGTFKSIVITNFYFIMQNETMIVTYMGDFDSSQMIRYQGDNWDLSILLKDSQNQIVLGAEVFIYFSGLDYNLSLIDQEDGFYNTLVLWDDVKSIFTQTTYQGQLTVVKANFETLTRDVTFIINLRIIDLNLAGDFDNTQITKVKGDQWNLSLNLKDTSKYFLNLTGVTVSLVFPRLNNYEIVFEDIGFGTYSNMINWSDVRSIFVNPTSYLCYLLIQKETYKTQNISITLIIQNRVANLTYQGDFNNANIVKINGESFNFQIKLLDMITKQAIIGATVSISFDGLIDPIFLTDLDGDGIYTATITFSKEEANAFFRDITFSASLLIEIEDYDIISENIVVKVKMAEFYPGFPTFYLLLAISGVVILVGSISAYRYVQYARIPAFVKLIDKALKAISGNKIISDGRITLSIEEEIIEQYHDAWDIIDLDLTKILGGSPPSPSESKNLGFWDNSQGGN